MKTDIQYCTTSGGASVQKGRPHAGASSLRVLNARTKYPPPIHPKHKSSASCESTRRSAQVYKVRAQHRIANEKGGCSIYDLEDEVPVDKWKC